MDWNNNSSVGNESCETNFIRTNLVRKLRRRWYDYIKTYLSEIDVVARNFIVLPQYRISGRPFTSGVKI
jgi:hypothetical protein